MAVRGPVPVLTLDRLPPAEQELLVQFLCAEKIKFHRRDDDKYVARICMTEAHAGKDAGVDASGDDDDALVERERRQAEAEAVRRRGGMSASSASPAAHSASGRRAAQPLSAMDLTSRLAERGVSLDARPFRRFVELIRLRDAPSMKHRELPWAMRIIEEIYDERYKREQEVLAAEEASGAPAAREARPFPDTVVEFVKKRYGLARIVEGNCIDLLLTVTRSRGAEVACDTFARFLEEHYDEDELLFFLYVRSVAQKVLGNVTFRSMWSDAGRGGGARGPGLSRPSLDRRQASHIARIVFASEADPHYLAFMAVVDESMEREGAAALDVGQFLHLAVEEYHDTMEGRDDDDGADGGGRSEDRTARLVAEADRGYEDRRRAAEADAGGPGDEGDEPADDVEARRLLLSRLSETLNGTNEEYVDRLLDQMAPSDEEAAEAMRSRLSKVLAGAVDDLLMQAISDTDKGNKAVSEETNPVGARFYAVLSSAGDDSVSEQEVGDRIEALCNTIIDSPAVRAAMEPAVTLLVRVGEEDAGDE